MVIFYIAILYCCIAPLLDHATDKLVFFTTRHRH